MKMAHDFIGKNLRMYRKAKGLTQGEVAQQAGISRTAYRNIETGKADPKVDTLISICNALGVKIQDVCTPARTLRVRWN